MSVFLKPFERYDLYCILGLSLTILAILCVLSTTIIIFKHRDDRNFFEVSLKNHRLRENLIDTLKKAQKNPTKITNDHRLYDTLRFVQESPENATVEVSVINNTSDTTLNCTTQREAQGYLNTSSIRNTGAKALLIGPNQCGKSYLSNKYAKSLKGLSVCIKIDANDFCDKEKTNHLANLLSSLIKDIKKNNKNEKEINFILQIEEFDSKSKIGSYNLNIQVFKQKIFDVIFDDPQKPQWLIPHLIITANNEISFDLDNLVSGTTNDKNTFLARIPNKFIFQRLEKNRWNEIIENIFDNIKYNNADKEEKKQKIIQELDERITNNNNRNDKTATMREISEEFDKIVSPSARLSNANNSSYGDRSIS